MKCCARGFLNYSNLSEVKNCVKCAELAIQLQQVLDELSSVQLIIQMLNKEHVQEDAVATLIQQMEAEQEVNESWKVMTIRGPKRRTESKIKLRENELIHSKEQTVVTANRYATLETDSSMPRNENRMKTVYEDKPRAISNEQTEKMKYTGQDCLTTKEPQEELNMKTKVELNVQNPSWTCQQSNIKEEEETYTITSIISGRISRKDTGRTIKQKRNKKSTMLSKVVCTKDY